MCAEEHVSSELSNSLLSEEPVEGTSTGETGPEQEGDVGDPSESGVEALASAGDIRQRIVSPNHSMEAHLQPKYRLLSLQPRIRPNLVHPIYHILEILSLQ